MKRSMLILVPIISGLLTKAQVRDLRSCKVIAAFVNDTSRIHAAYQFERWSLPVKHDRADINSQMDSNLFKTGIIRPEENMIPGALLSNADLLYMKETCRKYPGRYAWNRKLLERMGVHTSDTLEFSVPPTIDQMSLIKVKMSPVLFSKDRKKAVFYAEYYAETSGGEGSIWLFEKRKGKWVPVISQNLWIN